MTTTAWILAAAVIAATSWIVAIVGGHLARGDRRRRRLAEAAVLESRLRALEAARPGADADSAIEVEYASQIEPRAERGPCPRCGGGFHVDTHSVRTLDTGRLRHVRCRCGGCGTERVTWFRVRPADDAPA